ncbi:MAG: SDR family NAD(P)-dependent oxidoreductase [Bacteroidia bacterium]|nr:SDR family NAD(P)-dependent oxidoreductase [Bacteroidia bacterium]
MVKHVVISGAAGQLGRVVCREFLAAGYFVHALVSKNDTTVWDLSSGFVAIHKLDLTDKLEVEQFISLLKQSKIAVHAALFLAGGYAEGTIQNTSRDQINMMFKVNFDTAFYLSQALFNEMNALNADGYLFFVGARPAIEPEKGSNAVAYTLSKSALLNLAQLYSLAPDNVNIHVHVIIPSIIDTPVNRANMPEADFSKWITPEFISQRIIHIINRKDNPGLIVKMYAD